MQYHMYTSTIIHIIIISLSSHAKPSALQQPSCGQTVDHYVECEKSIIFMDMLLQDIAVYRHILFNADNFVSIFCFT